MLIVASWWTSYLVDRGPFCRPDAIRCIFSGCGSKHHWDARGYSTRQCAGCVYVSLLSEQPNERHVNMCWSFCVCYCWM